MYLLVSESMMTNVTMPIRIVAMRILPHGHLRVGGVICGSLLLLSLLVLVSAVE